MTIPSDRRAENQAGAVKPLRDHIGKMPLEQLMDGGALRAGQKVLFRYSSESGKERVFQGFLQRGGIEIDGEVYSISYSAALCMQGLGDQKPINGWMAWQTEEGQYLAETYLQFHNEKGPLDFSKVLTEKFYQYPARRDVVFIFGAGASYADGAPLQQDIMPLLVETSDNDLRNSLVYQTIKDFLQDNFIWDTAANYYPTLEEGFGFLDYFIQKGESLNRKYPLGLIIEIKEALIKLTHYIISSNTSSSSRAYRLFWETISKRNTNISAITLNYDTFIEDAFIHMFPRNMYLDYCLSLANYDYSNDIDAKNWWVNPREPILSPENIEPVSIKLIKLHGSLNWKYCNCCNQVLLTPLDKKLDLGLGDRSWHSRLSKDRAACPTLSGMRCSRDGNEFQTLLVPPSHMKNLNHPVNSRLFIECSDEIRRAKKVVFIGYSLSEADVHIKAILKKSLRPPTQVFVVDINTSEALRYRYRGITSKVEFIPSSFDTFLQDEGLVRKILSETAF